MTDAWLDEALDQLDDFWKRAPQPEVGRAVELLRQRFRTRRAFIDALSTVSPDPVQADDILVYRWERGKVNPGNRYRTLLSELCAKQLTMMDAESRRQFLGRLMAVAGRGILLRPLLDVATDPIIHALDVIDGDHLDGRADGLAELIDHYAQTICALPPADLYDELLTVRSYASRIIARRGRSRFPPQRMEIVLAAGWLSNLLAIAACDMGEHAAAHVWCFDAERRSRDAGHPELAAWAIWTRAVIAYYQRRSRQSIALVRHGKGLVPIGTVIHAKLAAQEMRALGLLGDAAGVTQARRYAASAIATLPSDTTRTGAFSIALGDDPPYTATSLLLVGRFHEAVSATNRVIQTFHRPERRQSGENPSGYARSLLILGLAQAGVGHLDEAVAAGQAALAGDRPAWPTMVLAGRLDQVLARDFRDAGQTAAYHAGYLEAIGHPTGHDLRPSSHSEDSE